MTGRERVFAALGGKRPDHPPYGFVTGSLGARLAGVEAALAYADPEAYVRGQSILCGIYDPDVVFTPFAFTYEALAYGGELAPQVRGAPNLRRPPFRDAVSALKAMDAAGDPTGAERVGYLLEAARLLSGRARGERLVVAPIVAPVDLPALLIGLEPWLDALLFHGADAAFLAERCVAHFAAMAKAYAAAGVDALACPMVFVNPAILDPGHLQRLALPILARCFADSPLPIIAHHGGNRIVPNLSLYSGLSKVAGFALGDGEDYAQARAALGPARLIMATVPGPAFDAFSPETLKARLGSILSRSGADSAWGLTGSGAELPAGTPEGLLAVVREVMRATA